VVALAWAGGLAAVVGVAAAGSIISTRSVPVPSVEVAEVAPPLTRASADATRATTVAVEDPARAGAVITTPGLLVQGSRSGPAGQVRVTLESSGAKLVASETIPASGAGGAFRVEFPLSNPRPGGTMVVQVVAFDSAGIPVDVVRIPVEIGAIVPAAPAAVARNGSGPMGDDGLIGGIVFGTAWDPDALTRP
jgi:hypothetical protein